MRSKIVMKTAQASTESASEAPCAAAKKRALFICTGNYYRSRFAEAVFNCRCEREGLAWTAFSRGLAIHLAPSFPFISEHTAAALAKRNIDLRHSGPARVQLTQEDLASADVIIALKEKEHRPMFARQFPAWEDRVNYWAVSDLDEADSSEALPAIERMVAALIERLRREA